jgi:hypothetical protein
MPAGGRPTHVLCGCLAWILALEATALVAFQIARRPPSSSITLDERYPATGYEPPRPYIVAWGQALRNWLKQEPSNPLALTALGAWIDCLNSPLSDSAGYWTSIDSLPDVDRRCIGASIGVGRPYCAEAAGRAYRAALKTQPLLEEAQLRYSALGAAGSLSTGDMEPGRVTLAKLGRDGVSPEVRYLANMVLAESHLRLQTGSLSAAQEWFTRAAGVSERWIAPRIGLAAVAARGMKTAPMVEVSGSISDPWYRYPCEILTTAVRERLQLGMSK